MVLYLIFQFSFLLFGSVKMVAHYAETGFPKLTKASIVIGYVCGFGILLLVPLDIGTVVSDRKVSLLQYQSDVTILSGLYKVFFFTILILNSFVLAYQGYYDTDGFFTVQTRAVSSLIRMLKDLVLPLVAGLIVFGLLVGTHTVDASSTAGLSLTSVILTNILYESFLMFLLAYGLIGLPRDLWLEADYESSLIRAQNKAAADYKDIAEHRFNVSIAVADVLKTREQCSNVSPQVLVAMKTVAEECPTEFKSSKTGTPAVDESGNITLKTLATLRTRLRELKDKYRVAQNNVEVVKYNAYFLEDMVGAIRRQDGVKKIFWNLKNEESTKLEYEWYIRIRPLCFQVSSVVAGIMSFLCFIGVICSIDGVAQKTNIFYLATHQNVSKGQIAMFIMLTLGYTCFVTMWSLFQMRLGGQMNLIRGKTTPSSLLFNCKMILKLAAPLVFFYLGWVAENGMKDGDWLLSAVDDDGRVLLSAFSHFYQLQSVGIIKNSFGTLFPIFMFILLILMGTNLLNLMLVKANLPSLQFGIPIVTPEDFEEGKRQLDRAKKIAERSTQRQVLKKAVGNDSIDGRRLAARFLTRFGAKYLDPELMAELEKQQLEEKKVASSSSPPSRHGNKASASSSTPTKGGQEADGEAPGADSPSPSPSKELVMLSPSQTALVALKPPKRCCSSALWKDEMHVHLSRKDKWLDCFIEVMPPGLLKFARDETSLASKTYDKTFPLPVHMTLVLDIMVEEEKKGAVGFRVHLELPDEVLKLRLPCEEDARALRVGLLAWKDYAMQYTNLCGGLLDDNEIDEMEKGGGGYGLTLNMRRMIGSLDGVAAMTLNPMLASDTMKSVRRGVEERAPTEVPSPTKKSPRKKSSIAARPGGPVDDSALGQMSERPAHLEGWLQKKKETGRWNALQAVWHRRYCRVNEDSQCFEYFRSDHPSEPSICSIDLLSVGKISLYNGSGKFADPTRFNICGEDSRTLKFKASSALEGEKWVSELDRWKDYFVMRYAYSMGAKESKQVEYNTASI